MVCENVNMSVKKHTVMRWQRGNILKYLIHNTKGIESSELSEII
jgi:hypothetical protein